ncbi:MAG: flagellar motor switch protein FliN [Gammaproteobacteria bacterium]|nr:flagellar motor switch protein FliN [Gammaproteobacteria bacterium]
MSDTDVGQTQTGQPATDQQPASPEAATPPPATQAASFDELTPEKTNPGSEKQIDVILDVPVTLSLEVGRSQINVGQLLQLSQGSVVELDRLAGEPLDVLVNGTLIAHGEIVVVNDKFGIRLTDVVSPAERVRKLR